MTFSPTTEDTLGLASEHDEREAVLSLVNEYDDLAGWNLGYGPTPLWSPHGSSTAFDLGFERGRREWLNDCAS